MDKKSRDAFKLPVIGGVVLFETTTSKNRFGTAFAVIVDHDDLETVALFGIIRVINQLKPIKRFCTNSSIKSKF